MREIVDEYVEETAEPLLVVDQPPKVYPDLLNVLPEGSVVEVAGEVNALGAVPTPPFTSKVITELTTIVEDDDVPVA